MLVCCITTNIVLENNEKQSIANKNQMMIEAYQAKENSLHSRDQYIRYLQKIIDDKNKQLKLRDKKNYVQPIPHNQNKSSNNYGQLLGTFNITFYTKEDFPNTPTYTGVMPQAGVTVAVDPNIIPLGSHIYIEGIGTRIAQDTGGAIKGNKLDVFVMTNNEAYSLGVQNQKVWLIK